MPGGRPPTGVDLVDGFEASGVAKLRCKAILETISGAKSIAEACEKTGLKEAMIHMLRTQAIEGALGALEPKPMGRPRKIEEADPREVERLRAESCVFRRIRPLIPKQFGRVWTGDAGALWFLAGVAGFVNG